MDASYIGYGGIILIIVGVLYIFLKASGFFRKEGEEGEIESKMFTLKGGPGIILVGLGALLLIISVIAGGPTPNSSTNRYSPEIKPTVTEPNVNPPTVTETTINLITSDYLIGEWIKNDKTRTFTFNSDGTLLYTVMSTSTSTAGEYTLTDSTIYLKLVDGEKLTCPLSYVDQITFKMCEAVYERATNQQTINQPTTPVPVQFMIYDNLGTNQINEQVSIAIDGKDVGTLIVDVNNPHSNLPVTVSQEGKHSYSATSYLIVNNNGQSITYYGNGQGYINVASGKNFWVTDDYRGNTVIIGLSDTPS